jgi:hypothetical protein
MEKERERKNREIVARVSQSREKLSDRNNFFHHPIPILPLPPSIFCVALFAIYCFLSWLWNAEDKYEKKRERDRERSVIKTNEMYEMHRWM